jgi:hypothetical protein
VDRLPPGQQCVETDDDERALAVFMEAIEQTQAMDRADVRCRAAELFDTDRIMDAVITSLHPTRLSGGRPWAKREGRSHNGRQRRANCRDVVPLRTPPAVELSLALRMARVVE